MENGAQQCFIIVRLLAPPRPFNTLASQIMMVPRADCVLTLMCRASLPGAFCNGLRYYRYGLFQLPRVVQHLGENPGKILPARNSTIIPPAAHRTYLRASVCFICVHI